MEKYKSKDRLESKQSTMSILVKLYKDHKRNLKRMYAIDDRIEYLNKKGIKESEEIDRLYDELDELDKREKEYNKVTSLVRKEFLKVGSIVVGGAVLVTGAASLIQYNINNNRKDTVMEALSKQGPSVVSMYNQEPNKLDEFIKSPKDVTQLALDTLKQNLADHYEGSKKDDFVISYNTSSSDKDTGNSTITYSITYQGKEISSYVYTVSDSTGEKNIKLDTMPKELRKAIDAIVKAQDSDRLPDAYNALKMSGSNGTLLAINEKMVAYLPGVEQER